MSTLKTVVGMEVKSKKDGKVYQVVALDDKNVTVLMDGVEKEIAKSTFERWYDEATTAEGNFDDNQQALTNTVLNSNTVKGVKVADKGKEKGVGAKTKPVKTEEETQAEAEAKAIAAKEKAEKKEAEAKIKADSKIEADKLKAIKKEEANKAKVEKSAEAERVRAEKLANKQNLALKEPKTPDPVIVALREELETFAKGLGDDVILKDANNYRGIFIGTKNICEVHPQKKKFKIHVNSASLNETMLANVKVVPKSFGWTLDAIYNITNREELEYAKLLVSSGRDFRKTV